MGQEVRALDPGVQISTYGTLEGSLQEFYRGSRFQLATLSAFAGIGLVRDRDIQCNGLRCLAEN